MANATVDAIGAPVAVIDVTGERSNVFERLRIELTQHAAGMKSERQYSGERPNADADDEDQRPHHFGNRTIRIQDASRDGNDAERNDSACGYQGSYETDCCAERRTENRDRRRLQQ